jgi:hypothetical protein
MTDSDNAERERMAAQLRAHLRGTRVRNLWSDDPGERERGAVTSAELYDDPPGFVNGLRVIGIPPTWERLAQSANQALERDASSDLQAPTTR